MAIFVVGSCQCRTWRTDKCFSEYSSAFNATFPQPTYLIGLLWFDGFDHTAESRPARMIVFGISSWYQETRVDLRTLVAYESTMKTDENSRASSSRLACKYLHGIPWRSLGIIYYIKYDLSVSVILLNTRTSSRVTHSDPHQQHLVITTDLSIQEFPSSYRTSKMHSLAQKRRKPAISHVLLSVRQLDVEIFSPRHSSGKLQANFEVLQVLSSGLKVRSTGTLKARCTSKYTIYIFPKYMKYRKHVIATTSSEVLKVVKVCASVIASKLSKILSSGSFQIHFGHWKYAKLPK